MRLPDRIDLVKMPRDWLNAAAAEYHYMHRPVHARASPFGWAVSFDGAVHRPDGKPCGFIMFASIHYTRLRGEFGYPGLPTKWQVLSLSRLWLHDDLPRNSATVTISKALKRVQRRWLEVHPPVDLSEPYHVRKIISYADTRFHEGTIYYAANFRFTGETVSRKRHKNTRGTGIDGALLKRFIYDLKKPRWTYSAPVQMALPLFEEAAR